MIVAYRTHRIANLDVFSSQTAAIVDYVARLKRHMEGAKVVSRVVTGYGCVSLYLKNDGEWLCTLNDHAADEEVASVHRQYINAAKMYRNHAMSICAQV